MSELIISSGIHIKDACKIKKSPYDGEGLFALIDLIPGIRLIDSKGKNVLGIKMNDADFQLPKDDSYESFHKTFLDYEATKDNSKCNVQQGNGEYLVIRPIKTGEELTKRYGLNKWIGHLTIDIYLLYGISGHNVFGDPDFIHKCPTLQNLTRAGKDFGYQFSMNKMIDKTTLRHKR